MTRKRGGCLKQQDSIFELEDYLTESRLVEKAVDRTTYDIRRMSEHIKKLGRPLTAEEVNQFII